MSALKLASPPICDLPTVTVAKILAVEASTLRVEAPGLPPLSARLGVALDRRRAEALAAAAGAALLVFEGGDPARPIVVGVLEEGFVEAPAPGPEPAPAPVAEVDGERVVLRGREVIELTCGEASITLYANGKVLLRGVYVETRASGTNRIKGASVQIN